jgi:hypothetical protein
LPSFSFAGYLSPAKSSFDNNDNFYLYPAESRGTAVTALAVYIPLPEFDGKSFSLFFSDLYGLVCRSGVQLATLT